MKKTYEELKETEKNIDFSAAAKHIAKDQEGVRSSDTRFEDIYNQREADKAIEWSIDMCNFIAGK